MGFWGPTCTPRSLAPWHRRAESERPHAGADREEQDVGDPQEVRGRRRARLRLVLIALLGATILAAIAPPNGRPPWAADDPALVDHVGLFFDSQPTAACISARRALPSSFRTKPSVWISARGDEPLLMPLGTGADLRLCLHGFSPSEPIDVVVTTGDVRARTLVVPSDGDLRGTDLPPDTLFRDGLTLPVAPEDGAILASPDWWALPPIAVVDEMAAAGEVRVTATQGALTVETEQPVLLPTEVGEVVVSPHDVGDVRLRVWGFSAGATVPIGLYVNTDFQTEGYPGPNHELIRQIAEIVMPPHRVAEFAMAPDLLEGAAPGYYCVHAPGGWCHRVWPEFPGAVRPGDQGEAVRLWQDILIGARALANTLENRDGVYSAGQAAEIARWLELEYRDFDGDLALDLELYAYLTDAELPASEGVG